jgi:sugar diacid utilization regulator
VIVELAAVTAGGEHEQANLRHKAKDQRSSGGDTGGTLAESLRATRPESDLHRPRWPDAAPDREKLRLTGAQGVPLASQIHSKSGAGSPLEDVSDVRTMLKELHGRMLAAALDGEGLEGVARLASAAAGAPIALVVPELTSTLMPVGTVHASALDELEQCVRERIRGRPCQLREDLVAEVPLRLGDRLVGAAVIIDAGDQPHPLAAWILDVAATVALTAVAIEEARIDTEHRLRGSFLEQLRSGQELNAVEITKRARRLGCDITFGAVMLCVAVEGGRPRMVASAIGAEYPGAFAEPIDSASGDAGAQQVWAVLPAADGDETGKLAEAAAKRVAKRVRQYGPVGVSRFHREPSEFPRALDEAELMLDVMLRSVLPTDGDIVDGTYKLLFRLLASHPDELSQYHDVTIAPLAQHDEQYRTDLVRTLEAYLETNCNMNVTAETIFAHRHTIAHRLERIHELTGLNASVHEDRERLGLGLKIHRLIMT